MWGVVLEILSVIDQKFRKHNLLGMSFFNQFFFYNVYFITSMFFVLIL